MSERKTKTGKLTVAEAAADFLFAELNADADYQTWSNSYELPAFITNNLNKTKKLRHYQGEAVKRFIYLFNRERSAAAHWLFNMATGSGKTLVMAACVLYLYEQGYRNFLFLVNQIQIKDQAKKCLTDYKYDKYLFNPNGVKFCGRKVEVRAVERLPDSSPYAINFLFFSTSLLYNRLSKKSENTLTLDDFIAGTDKDKNKIVFIADEAHHLNVDTKRKKEAANENNWENAVMSAVNANPENILLEFTATVDLKEEKIRNKYRHKIIFKYDFIDYNGEGYSKDVKFLYSLPARNIEQRRLLVLNAVMLSQYRKKLAEEKWGLHLNPVVLFKSKTIEGSKDDRKFFNEVIASLRPAEINAVRNALRDSNLGLDIENRGEELHIVHDMVKWLNDDRIGGFINSLRVDFAPERTLVYNSQKQENPEALLTLDNPKNAVRAVFSVQALTEGWDVLSLFDIVHFDISAAKKVSLADIQLIGRGARYCPFLLPKRYLKNDPLFPEWESVKDKRKFDNERMLAESACETLFYHFIKTGNFLEELQKELLGAGIIKENTETRTITMKPEFLDSDTYRNGFVLVNRIEKRKKTTEEQINRTFKQNIEVRHYSLHGGGFSAQVRPSNERQLSACLKVDERNFTREIIQKALMQAENGFFRYHHLRQHLTGIKSVDEFIEKYLPLYTVIYIFDEGKEFIQLTAAEKLQLLTGSILPEVRKKIDAEMPAEIGSKTFKPVPLSKVFKKEKRIHLTAFPVMDSSGITRWEIPDERGQPQTDNDKAELQYDVKNAGWYAYDENYGTGEEKHFVRFIAAQMENLQEKYTGAEVFLVRNELDYRLFSPHNGQSFCPDYLLFINDKKNKTCYYQCLMEPKGGHLLQKDEWKEQELIELNRDSKIVSVADEDDAAKYTDSGYQKYLESLENSGYKEIKNIGFEFYNYGNPGLPPAPDNRGEQRFAKDFRDKLL